MALEEIPISDAADKVAFYFLVELDGTDYQCSFRWNSREGFWYMSLFDLDGNPIRTGLKVVANWPLIRLDRTGNRPPGEIVFVDAGEVPADPGLEDLGERVGMVYIPSEDAEGNFQ